ncbi:MAG: DUF4404 family protein [Planctomycetia bacterium]|nr:DUF4404 family protein [Planctomycetia bacterium]
MSQEVDHVRQHDAPEQGESREVPIASQRGFTESWLPLCERLGLQFVSLFAGGALTTIPEELIPEITRELRLLLAEVEAAPDHAWIAERINNILTAFAETNPAEWEYSFG